MLDLFKMLLMFKSAKAIVLVVLLASFMMSCGGSKSVVVEDAKVTYGDIQDTLHPIQEKYGRLLNVKGETITNIPLYEFIDDWMNTPYKLGGETKNGIDCSSFTQLLFTKVFDSYIERTAQKQFDSENTDKFRLKKYLKEGDLLFFKSPTAEEFAIIHVGIYLKDNKFINATSYKGSNGAGGVKIDDLTNPFWEKRYVAGGRRLNLTKTN